MRIIIVLAAAIAVCFILLGCFLPALEVILWVGIGLLFVTVLVFLYRAIVIRQIWDNTFALWLFMIAVIWINRHDIADNSRARRARRQLREDLQHFRDEWNANQNRDV